VLAATGAGGVSKGKAYPVGSTALGISVETLGVGAATDLQVNAQVAATIALNQLFTNIPPPLMIVIQLDANRIKAVVHAINVGIKTYHLPVVGGHYFINAIAEKETAIHG